MELRSQKHNTLKEMLKSIGVYEDGMDVEEMSHLAQALQMSTGSSPSEFLNIQRAIMETELDFHSLVNSTMIDLPLPQVPCIEGLGEGSFERECESPPSCPVQIQVQAVVHHDLNWSPSRPSSKRRGSQAACDLNLKRTPQTVQPRSDVDVAHLPLPGLDSGSSYNELSSFSSISESSLTPSIGEMPSQHLISTSSAAVSDISEHHSNNTDFNY